MRTLIVYLEDGQVFDKTALTDALSSIEGVYELNGMNFDSSDVACEYTFNGDSATLRLEGEPTALSIESISEAGVKLVWELQKRENRDLRVTDEDYSFNFNLKEIKTTEEIRQKIQERYFDKRAIEMEEAEIIKTV